MTVAGIRANNPFDVSLPIKGYSGPGQIIGVRGQPGFAQFPDMQTGYNAGVQRLNTYITGQTKYGTLDSISSLNSVYATDQNWKYGVSKASGIGLNETLDPNNADQMAALQRGVLSQELGASNAKVVLSQVDQGAVSGSLTQTAGIDTSGTNFPADNTFGGDTSQNGFLPGDPSGDVAAYSNNYLTKNYIPPNPFGAAKDTLSAASGMGAGMPLTVGLQASTSKVISDIFSGLDKTITGAFQGATAGLVSSAENWVIRGFLMVVGIILIVVALWAMLSKAGVAPSPGETARAAVKFA
jgi:hypothetical protein